MTWYAGFPISASVNYSIFFFVYASWSTSSSQQFSGLPFPKRLSRVCEQFRLCLPICITLRMPTSILSILLLQITWLSSNLEFINTSFKLCWPKKHPASANLLLLFVYWNNQSPVSAQIFTTSFVWLQVYHLFLYFALWLFTSLIHQESACPLRVWCISYCHSTLRHYHSALWGIAAANSIPIYVCTAGCPLLLIYHICPPWHCALSLVLIIKSPEVKPCIFLHIFLHLPAWHSLLWVQHILIPPGTRCFLVCPLICPHKAQELPRPLPNIPVPVSLPSV